MLIGDGNSALLIGRLESLQAGFDPDLQQSAGLCACIDFAVHDSGSGAHPLHISSLNNAAVSGRILVVEFPLDHHRDDLHVAMGMHAKSPTGRNRVVIDDA